MLFWQGLGMNKIVIYFGPKKGFEEVIPYPNKTLAEFISEDDKKRKQFTIKKNDCEEVQEQSKEYIESLVAYSESYAGITESAIQSFISILNSYDINNLYLQNPPMQIWKQLEQAFGNMVEIKKYKYKTLTKSMFLKFDKSFSSKIIGQDKVKERILLSLYPLVDRKNENKPVVIMFYGASGVGKTETAKFISEVLGQKIFRKQFSMFHSSEFGDYLFGGNHFQSSFAKDLLERESNVILLDEFDKPAPVFHSAFYQLFDEGIFEDKNYNVELHNAIVICTSNYQNENEIRKHLGDPIFYRFNKFIKFEMLSSEALVKIIENILNEKYCKLSSKEQKKVDYIYIRKTLVSNVHRFNNVRQISNIIEEYLGIYLVKELLKTTDIDNK